MGLSFMTIVAAEMLAADEGLGFMIFNARLYMMTDRMFLGITMLGFFGLCIDKIFRMLIRRFDGKYTVEVI